MKNVCQRSDYNIAKGCEEWLKLEIPTVNDEMQQMLCNVCVTEKGLNINCADFEFSTFS